MKKVIIAIIGFLLLTILGLSIYVSTIDWNKHKETLSEQLMEITGKKVVFSGPVSMSIFPLPSLKATNVRVYSAVHQDLDHPLMKIKNLVAKLSFSALLGGSFDVKMMSLEKPEILVRYENSEINWLDNAKTNVDAQLKDINIALDSVMFNDATMIIEDSEHHINTRLKKLNAEIIAEGLRGPYRIDGSYTKDDNPQGFAISIGNISDSFATNLNFVLSQPASETYLRFDGTFLLNNAALNGNLILESQKFKTFYDTVVPSDPLPEYWNNHLESSMELKVNKTQIELANMILKYGQSAGAGNILIPLKSKSYIIGEDNDNISREVSVKFDMTDLDLAPIVNSINDFVRTKVKDEAVYSPDFSFDMVLDLSVLKAEYNNQTSKDLTALIKLKDNVWQIDSLTGEFPGGTQVKLSGKIFPVEDVLSYMFALDAKTNSLKKLFEWGNIPLQTVANSTYQKSSLKTTIVGNTDAIKFSPLTLALDNTLLSGQIGIKKGSPTHYAFELDTDNIILDNYIPRVFGEKNFVTVFQDFWKNATWANNLDIDLKLKAGLLIYEKTSFDNVVIKASLQKGLLNIETLSIADVLQSHLEMSGEISGFANQIQMSNLNYKVSISDYDPWLKYLNIEQPKWNYRYFEPFTAEGVVSRNKDNFWMKVNFDAGKTNLAYNGRLNIDEKYSVDGEIRFRTPDMNAFFASIPVNYDFGSEKLGRLGLKGKIVGNKDKFKVSEVLFNVGSNTFQGILGADLTRSEPYVAANLKINRFEPEKFLPKESVEILSAKQDTEKKDEQQIVNKPILSQRPFQREMLNKITFAADLTINELLIKKKLLKNVKAKLENRNGQLTLSDMQGAYNDGNVSATLKFNYLDKPRLSGDVSIMNQHLHDLALAQSGYGLKSGTAEVHLKIDTSAVSPQDLLDHFSGMVTLNIDAPVVQGINLGVIADDLKERHAAAGLQQVLMDNLKKDETSFNKFSSQINFKDGEWQLERTALKSDLAIVDVSGDGNLANWDMNNTFYVQLSEPKNIQPFMFMLKGDISKPELSVDASPITKVYADQIAKEKAAQKAREEAHRKELQQKMAEQGKKIKTIKASLETYIKDTFIPMKEKIVLEQQKVMVGKLQERLQYYGQLINEAEILLAKKEIKDDYPGRLSKVNKLIEKELPEIDRQMQDFYMQSMKATIAANYKAILAENKAKENLIKESLAQHEVHVLRLSGIRTGYNFETDKMYHELLDAINNQMNIYDAIVKNASKYGEISDTLTDIEIAEQYAEDSKEMLEKAKNQREALAKDIEKYLVYVDDKLKKEEKAITDKKEEENQEQKPEETIKTEEKGVITPSQSETVPTMILGVDQVSQGELVVPTLDNIGEVKADQLEVDIFRKSAPKTTATGTIIKQ